MIILIIFLGLLFICALLICLAVWRENRGPFPRIKLKDFKKFYALNPERWDIAHDYVGCKTSGAKYEYFSFGFIDYMKYLSWKDELESDEKTKTSMESIQRMLDAVKEDIAKVKAREATDSMAGITQLLKDIEAQGIDCVPPSLIEFLKKHGIE